MNSINVGVIGTGRMGVKRIADIVSFQGSTLRWVCSRKTERAAHAIEECRKENPALGEVDAVEDWETAVHRSDTDAVVITTPNSEHATVVPAALKAGKHVFVEYPHAVSHSEQEKIRQVLESSDTVFHIGLTHRYSQSHTRLVQEYFHPRGRQKLGRPVSVQKAICSGNPISRWYDDPHRSGGMFVSSMFHFLDEALAEFGNPEDVWAAYDVTYRESGAKKMIAADCADVTLRFPGSPVYHLSYARGFPRPGLGTRTTYIFEGGYLVSGQSSLVEMSPQGTGDVFPKQMLDSDRPVERDTHTFLAACLQGGDTITKQRNCKTSESTIQPGTYPTSAQTVEVAFRTLDLALEISEKATVSRRTQDG